MAPILALGLTNWFVTLIITGSEIFRPVREWVDTRLAKSARFEPDSPANEMAQEMGFDGAVTFSVFWSKARYLVGCPVCCRTWAALVSTAFTGPVILTGLTGFVLTWFTVAAIGHLILEVQALLMNWSNK